MTSSPFKYTNKLHGRRVLVIGGSSGIGFAVAESALEHGALVTISSSNQTKLDAAVARLEAHAHAIGLPPSISAKTCDLSHPDTLDANITALLQFASRDGKLDHVAFTAGDAHQLSALADVQVEQLRVMTVVRHYGPIILAKHLPQYMHISTRSSLTLTTGSSSRRPSSAFAIVAGNAAAIEGFTRGFAVALKPVRVNCVMPGWVKTELFDSIGEEEREGMMDKFGRDCLLGTVGTPEELAEPYLYLMKDSFATGALVECTGGRLTGDLRE